MNKPSQKSLVRYVQSWWRWLDKNSAMLLLSLAILAFGSAFLGLTIAPPNGAVRSDVTVNLYEAAQIIFLGMDPHASGGSIFLPLARVSSVIFVTLVATKAIGRLFKESMANLRLRLRGKRNVLTGGLGMIGWQVTRDYSRSGKLVVVQEINYPNYWTDMAEEYGAVVLKGDVTDPVGLREHLAREPEIIHLVTGNDQANINALANIRRLRHEFRQANNENMQSVECFVQLDDYGLLQALSRSLVESDAAEDPNMKIRLFNVYREIACQLVIDELTPLRPTQPDEVALYILFGFEKMGMSILKELAEYAHFENQKRARVLVLSTNARQDMLHCLAQWGRLSPAFHHTALSNVEFDARMDEWDSQLARPDLDVESPPHPGAIEYVANVHFCQIDCDDAVSQADVRELVRLATAAKVRPVLLFCSESDETNFRLACHVNNCLRDFHGINCDLAQQSMSVTPSCERSLPIFVFLPNSLPLRELLKETGRRSELRPFGSVREAMARVHAGKVDEVAIDLAWDYQARQKRLAHRQTCPGPECQCSDETQGVISREEFAKTWPQRPLWERRSNVAAAEHALIKARMLGYRAVTRTTEPARSIDLSTCAPTSLSTLAYVEHNRWVSERLLMGWSHGPRQDRPPQRETICWREFLSAEELKKDSEQLARVFEFLTKENVSFETLHANRT